MGEPFRASEQYDDLTGTVAIDGHTGPFLHELVKHVKLPPGYWPVGPGQSHLHWLISRSR